MLQKPKEEPFDHGHQPMSIAGRDPLYDMNILMSNSDLFSSGRNLMSFCHFTGVARGVVSRRGSWLGFVAS